MSQSRLMLHRWRADKQFAALSAEARDLFYGLMGIADSWGCLQLNAVPIRNEVYLGAEDLPALGDVQDWLRELLNAGLLREWFVGDKEYAELKWFMDEQRIRWRRKRETPCPPWRDATDQTAETLETLETLGNGSDGADGPSPKRRDLEVKRGEEPPEGGSSLRSGHNPEEPGAKTSLGPPHGDVQPPVPTIDQRGVGRSPPGVGQAPAAPASSALVDLGAYVSGLPPPETPQGEAAWGAILACAADWGPVLPSTLETLAEYVRRRPQLAVAWVLATAANPKVVSPWGALIHAIREGWAPPARDEDAARPLIKPPRLGADRGVARLEGVLAGLLRRPS